MPLPDYTELHGSPTETWDLFNGISAQRKLMCAWDDRYTLAAGLVGLSTYVHHGSAVLLATGCTIAPFNAKQLGTGNLAAYENAVLDIKYTVPTLEETEEESGIYVSESLEPAAEMMSLDHTGFKWKSSGDALKPDEAPGRMFSTLDYVVTRHRMASIPNWFLTLIGCINNDTVTAPLLGLSFAARTLLFNPPTLQRQVNFDMTSMGWNATIRLTHQPNEWNRFWNKAMPKGSAVGDYDEIQYGGTDYESFTEADFSVIFS